MSFVLVVRMRANEGSEDRVGELLAELARATREEPGCEQYIPCRDLADSRSFIIYEQYVDRAALDAHGESEHFQRLAAGELWPLLESRERTFFEPVVD